MDTQKIAKLMAQTLRRKGWIIDGDEYECSRCTYRTCTSAPLYCERCGSKMKRGPSHGVNDLKEAMDKAIVKIGGNE